MALRLTLKPGERAAINGAVIVNGDRRTNLVIENKARVLREGDVIQPEEANTPAKRIYVPIMMMYLDPSTKADMQPEYERRLLQFTRAVSDMDALGSCAAIGAHVANEEYYKALSVCRKLIEFEAKLLSHVL
ncbi:MAG: flagellar biosynthesis repressor FlbT [Pseudomonadota bacterium]